MPPFTVLHVCMGNICRSPMAERLLVNAARELAGEKAEELIYSSSAGTGGWHEGEPMNAPAARQVRRRGGDELGFSARRLRPEHIDSADLVLTATAEQSEYVVSLRPDAAGRTFVLGEFARLLRAASGRSGAEPTVKRPESAGNSRRADLSVLPPADLSPDAVYARGVALVAAVDSARAGAWPLAADEVDDPYGGGDAVFGRVADDIDHAVRALAAVLLAY